MKKEDKLATKFFQSEVDDYKKEFYESGYRTFMSVRLARFLEEIDRIGLPKNSKCLDAGCGPGYLTKELHAKGFIVSALDASPEMLRLTKSLFSGVPEMEQPKLFEGDIESLPFEDNSFDLVASAGVIEYLDGDLKALKEFYRVTKPNGCLILSSTNKYSPIGFFEPVVEAIKRNSFTRGVSNWFLRKMGGTPVRPRDFKVRKHTTKEFICNAENAGFKVLKVGYFYGLPWPHPIDRIFPKLTNEIGSKLENLSGTAIGRTFEGLYIVAIKV